MKTNKEFIEYFNKNKSKDSYREIFNQYFSDKPKCRICNDIIYYYDSTFTFKSKEIQPKGKSFLTSKNVDKCYYLNVCEDCLTEKYPEYSEKNKSRVFNQMNYITEYAFGIDHETALKWMKDKYAITEENLIKKWGVDIGKKKWDEYRNKQALTNTFEYKRDKYGWSEEEFKDYNKSRSVTIENLINRHGEEIGLKKWMDYCDRQKYTTTIEYFQEKHGDVKGREIYENFCKKRMMEFGYSNISQVLFEKIDNVLNLKSQYAIKDGEKFYNFNNLYNYYLDYYLIDLNIGIEFNGDIWHANPKKYKSIDKPIPYDNITSKDIWEKDRIKNDFLRTKLNKLIIIWEDDLNKDGIDKTVDKIIKEIYE